jgi:hypothetical protein
MKVACISFLRLNLLNKAKSIRGIAPKTNSMKVALLALFAVVIFSGCTKTYPQVNQVYSALYTVTPTQWIQGTDQDGTIFYSASFNIPELTQDIDLNGGVEVYLSFDDQSSTDPTYEALPEVVNGVAYGAIHTTGSVTIDLRAATGGNVNLGINQTLLVKIVLMQAQPLGN